MRKFIYIVYTLMVAVILTGCGADKFMKKGDKFYSLGEYYDAATQYKRAYSATPAKERATRGKRAKKLADCYRRINHAPKAIAAYNNVVRYKQEDSLTHFYLGQLYLRNGNYHDAERHFQLVLDSAKGKLKEPYLSLTKAGLKSAQQGPNWKKEGSKYTVKRMDIFNSRRADFSPMFAGDDNDQLYFTSTRNDAEGDDLNGVSYLCVNLKTATFFADMDSYMSEHAMQSSPLRGLFESWRDAGWLHVVPGETFDPTWPVDRIIELTGKGVNFMGFGYDPYNAKIVTNALGAWVRELGHDPKDFIIPVRQNFATYNPVVNELDYMVKRSVMDNDGHYVAAPMIHFSENPLWPWEFGNCVLAESSDGLSRKPVKRARSGSGKVDNIQMLLSALVLYDIADGREG
jgi:hypothetical protein